MKSRAAGLIRSGGQDHRVEIEQFHGDPGSSSPSAQIGHFGIASADGDGSDRVAREHRRFAQDHVIVQDETRGNDDQPAP